MSTTNLVNLLINAVHSGAKLQPELKNEIMKVAMDDALAWQAEMKKHFNIGEGPVDSDLRAGLAEIFGKNKNGTEGIFTRKECPDHDTSNAIASGISGALAKAIAEVERKEIEKARAKEAQIQAQEKTAQAIAKAEAYIVEDGIEEAYENDADVLNRVNDTSCEFVITHVSAHGELFYLAEDVIENEQTLYKSQFLSNDRVLIFDTLDEATDFLAYDYTPIFHIDATDWTVSCLQISDVHGVDIRGIINAKMTLQDCADKVSRELNKIGE